MHCRKVQKKFLDYLEKELTAEEQREMEKHLQKCHNCSAELAGIERILSALKEEKLPEPSERFWINFPVLVRKKLEEEQERETVPILRWATTLAAGVFLFILTMTAALWQFKPEQRIATGINFAETVEKEYELNYPLLLEKLSPEEGKKVTAKLYEKKKTFDLVETLKTVEDEQLEQKDLVGLIDGLDNEEYTILVTKLSEM
ncbi:MAG: zf-HC2 domain-containing protein [Candidatus Edwardsbacteria bacterium]